MPDAPHVRRQDIQGRRCCSVLSLSANAMRLHLNTATSQVAATIKMASTLNVLSPDALVLAAALVPTVVAAFALLPFIQLPLHYVPIT